jgi:hypothetical protein
MELIVILTIFAALAFGMAAYASYSPVNAALAQNSVSSLPGSADFFSGWAGLLFKMVLGFVITAAFTALVAGVLIPWVRAQWKNQGKSWKSGPNAHWGREAVQPPMNPEKMVMLALLSKLAGGAEGGPVVFQQPQEPPQEAQNQFPEGWW